VGYVNPVSGAVHIGNLRDVPGANANETNTKSFATDESGGVYVNSDYALYRYQVGPDGLPQNTWRVAYDRGVRQKPGQAQQGSGTTPTVFDDFAGNRFIAIADNADPFMHVNIYARQTGALVAQQAVFSAFPGQNACENSLIAVDHSLIIENNYGNADILSTIGDLTTVPGVDRVDFDPVTHQSSVAWENTTVAIPSVVSQLSTGDGLVYTYAKDHQGWFWAALDYGTGSMVAKTRVPLSDSLGGIPANNYYAGIGIGPDGSAYVGTFGGFVAWRPRAPLPDTVGAFDPVGEFGQPAATWYLRNSNSAGAPDIAPFAYGAAGWAPQAGIWTDPPRPLHVLCGGVLGGPPVNLLTQDMATALEAQAVARLQQDGVSGAVVARLAAVEVEVGALGPGVLATADPQSGRVVLDRSAAGRGWFVDPTPLRDEEFVAGAAGQPQAAAPGGAADGRADLLTALVQEMGVAAGLDDPALTGALAPGTRNVAALDAYFATL
jgi:hypothetical protein